MSYSNQRGQSPITLSNNLKIYSGTLTDGDSIAADLGDVQQGCLYISTAGSLFHKVRATADGNAWYKVSGTPETEKRLAAAAMTLLSSADRALIMKTKSVTETLTAKKFKSIITKAARTVTATLAASATAFLKKTKTVTIGALIGNDYSVLIKKAAKTVSAALSVGNLIFAVKAGVLKLIFKLTQITLSSSISKKVISITKSLTTTLSSTPILKAGKIISVPLTTLYANASKALVMKTKGVETTLISSCTATKL